MAMNTKDLSEVESRELMPGFNGKFVHTDRMTFIYWDIEEGAVLPEHSHEHEQVVNCFDGEFELTVSGETRILGPGTVTQIPGNAVHSGRALSDCKILDVFAPVREDYR